MRSAALLLAAAVIASGAELQPYSVIWNPEGAVAADLSFLLDKPAGNHGFVQVRNGHLADGKGDRLRLWGVNFSFTASTPAKDQAAAVAAHLARFGINCIRVHHLDWRAPRGVIDSRYRDSRHLDPEVLDKLDYFVSELKKHGVYVNLNLNVARAFQPGDQVKDAEQLGFGKAVTYFDPRIVELEKEYARTLLTHRNPYTGNEYRSEPGVAIVEILNENSLFESWKAGRLSGQGAGPKQRDRTWTDIPASYAQQLTAMYNEWLPKHLTADQLKRLHGEAGDPVPRLLPSGFAKASAFRFETEASFYMDVENRFFQDMYGFLKRDLGVRPVIVGTSIHNGGLTPYPLLASTAKLDMVDAHTYWQHPSYLTDAEGRQVGFTIQNSPAVNDPGHSPVATLSRVAVAGKPFMVSEVNHPYPSEYGAEGIPLLAAYGAFQDWDAIFWYSFSHSPAETWAKPSLPGHFDIRQDPVKMAEYAIAGLLFHRGDVAPAKQTVLRTYTREEVFESLRLPGEERPYFTPGLPPLAPLAHAIRVSSFDGPPFRKPETSPTVPVTSDTGQLHWQINQEKKGLVTVDSPRWQALIGYTSTQPSRAANLAAAVSNDFSAIVLASLEWSPIAKSRRLLLVTGARVGNSGMKWNEQRTTTVDPGQPGMLIEPVDGTVTLRGFGRAESVKAIPLDGGGRPGGPGIEAARSGANWNLHIGATPTPWYLIQVSR